MPAPLRLTLTDYLDATRWHWVLEDSRGRFLADHVVQLDPSTREYGGFRDLSQYLEYNKPIHPPEKQLEELGAWIGEKVFGGLRKALWERRALPAVAVRVVVPPAARDLLSRPFELARFADGTSFRKAGVRFVYGLDEGPPPRLCAKEPAEKALRILAAFSLPVRANPLELRRERYGLQRLIRDLNQTQGRAVELRVLQYGATRDTLREALEEADGWDIIQLSGHGQKGELLLEDDRGGSDTIDADELGDLLEMARARLKLLILDACYSGVGSQAAARVEVGLDRLPVRRERGEGEAVVRTAVTALPSLAQVLSRAAGLRRPGDALPGRRCVRHRPDARPVREAPGIAPAASGGAAPGPGCRPGLRQPKTAAVTGHADPGGPSRGRAPAPAARAAGGDDRPAQGGVKHRLPARAGPVRGSSSANAPRQPGAGPAQPEARRAILRHARGGQDGLRAGAGLPP